MKNNLIRKKGSPLFTGYFLLILFLCIGTITTSGAVCWSADIAVVVNRENPVETLTPRQVSHIYLGRSRIFPTGEWVFPLEREINSAIRADFYKLLNGMSLKRLNAYWARLQFSGQVQPPVVIEESDDLLYQVMNNTRAIAYMALEDVNASVKVILYLRE